MSKYAIPPTTLLSSSTLRDNVLTDCHPLGAVQPAPDSKEQNVHIIRLFIAFQLIGLFGAFLMVLTVVCSPKLKARRHATWFNFMLSWMISATSYTLLFMAGQLEARIPEFGVCFAQAVLVYAAAPLYVHWQVEFGGEGTEV